MTVTPNSSLIFFRISIIFFELTESKFPVGSSANMILGLLISALAKETLCFSPPDIKSGFLFKTFSIFSVLDIDNNFSL